MRASTVMRSIPTSDTRTHASMTIPLSRTRSRTSMRLVPPAARSTGIGRSSCFYFIAPAVDRRRVTDASCRSSARTCLRNCSFSADTACLPGERWWSYFHQSRPICSALSIEQISSRILIVISSTSASDTLMSPATTRPLSRTRSSTSTRPVDRPCPSLSDVGIVGRTKLSNDSATSGLERTIADFEASNSVAKENVVRDEMYRNLTLLLRYGSHGAASQSCRLPHAVARRAGRRARVLRLRHLRLSRPRDRPPVLSGGHARLAAPAADVRHLRRRISGAPARRDRHCAFWRSARPQADVHAQHLPDGGAHTRDRPAAGLRE